MSRTVIVSVAVVVGLCAVAGPVVVHAGHTTHHHPALGHHVTAIPAGSFLVWDQVDPGTYHAPGGPRCTWRRSPSADPASPASTATGTDGTVTIDPADGRFISDGCGTWARAAG